jgi:hypothetical protein
VKAPDTPVHKDCCDARTLGERTVATEVYWLMPGPRAFGDAVAAAVVEHRWLTIRTPASATPGFASAIEAALHRAHLDNEQSRWVRSADHHEIAALIGTLFGVPALHPAQLAHMSGTVRTIVLEPKGEHATAACQQYLEAFAEAVLHVARASGQASVIAVLPESLGATKAPIARPPQQIVFSGALTTQEMQAYVAVRMEERSGPGSTELFRMLITEFAGFDAQLAEELIGFSDEALLLLPTSLSALSAAGDALWRTGRWSAGCYADVGGERRRHVLYELYLSRHGGPDQCDANEWLKRRYWRACLRSLLPWLEERRSRVIEVLRPALEQHLKGTGGKAVRTTASGHRIETSINDLEYNQIPALVLNESFRANGARPKLAVDLCFAAKRVRDSMAHMRPPEARYILDLTDLMQRLLG